MSSIEQGKELLPVYRIRPMPLVSIVQDLGGFTYGFNYGTKFDLPVYAWYIQGASQHVLVDTGGDARSAKEYRGFEAVDINSFDEAINKFGLRPQDIGMVIQTHLMWDHCVNMKRCTNARVVVQQDELEFALAPHPILARMYRRELFSGVNFQVVSGHCEILPGIELIPVRGHSAGCQAVSVNTEKGRAIISGFCCVKENFEPLPGARESMPVIAPGIHLDAVEAFNSVLRIKSMADIVIANHDPAFVNVDSIP